VALIFASGLGVMLIGNVWRNWRESKSSYILGLAVAATGVPVGQIAADAVTPFSGATLFVTFLKIGSVVFGSGYVLLAFLRNDFVYRLGWLTDRQILDAVAVGNLHPDLYSPLPPLSGIF